MFQFYQNPQSYFVCLSFCLFVFFNLFFSDFQLEDFLQRPSEERCLSLRFSLKERQHNPFWNMFFQARMKIHFYGKKGCIGFEKAPLGSAVRCNGPCCDQQLATVNQQNKLNCVQRREVCGEMRMPTISKYVNNKKSPLLNGLYTKRNCYHLCIFVILLPRLFLFKFFFVSFALIY